MTEYAVKTEQIQKKYGKQKALDHVSIHIEQGAIYGLIGRNGAGKTTLMKLIAGLASPTEGEIYLYGDNVKTNQQSRTRIGNLIENPGVYPQLTGFANMRLKAVAMGVYDKNRIMELMKLTGIADAEKKKVKHYSMGMKQRLGIALALIGSPDMLILDEPINGLDPQGINEVRALLIRLNQEKNMTILISSHILDELSKVATHYGIINSGNLIMEATTEELSEKCTEKIEIVTSDVAKASVLLESMNISEIKVVDDSTIQVFGAVNQSMEINRKLVLADIPVISIQVKTDTLEEFFLKTTAQNGGSIA